MTTYLGKSCSFGLSRVPFVNCRQFMYLVISLLVLRAGCGIWLYQFLILAYLFTLWLGPRTKLICSVSKGLYVNALTVVIWIQTLIRIRVVSFEYLGLFHVFLYTYHTWRSSHSWSWRHFIRLIHHLCKFTISSLNMHSQCSRSFRQEQQLALAN